MDIDKLKDLPELKFNLSFRDIRARKVISGKLLIRDGKAAVQFEDGAFIRKIYENEKRNGKKVNYKSENNIMTEEFEGKDKIEIFQILSQELKSGDIKFKEAK